MKHEPTPHLQWLLLLSVMIPLALGMLEQSRRLVHPTVHAQMPTPSSRGDGPNSGALTGPLPERLEDTGLFAAGSTTEIDPANLPFTPQYPLWTDGASKRRWIHVPPGTAIDARNPDAWVFPIGTKLWKEFSFGRRVETRFMERVADGSYRYATYLWSEDGTYARLASKSGVRVSRGLRGVEAHDVPSEGDCLACHEGKRTPVLGFTALQLSSDRDPQAPHREHAPEGALDLESLARRGLVKNLPHELSERPPRIAAPNPRARAALGYLYGNCGGCHNSEGPLASLGLDFDQRLAGGSGDAAVRETALGKPSRFVVPGAREALRIDPEHPEQSAVLYRMSSRAPASRMPPTGSRVVDQDALELVHDFIREDLSASQRNR